MAARSGCRASSAKPRALEMIMTGRTVDAEEAHRIGLVDRLVEGDALAQGIAFAREFSGYSLPVLGFAREAVKRALDNPITRGSSRRSESVDACVPDQLTRIEGMEAFIEAQTAIQRQLTVVSKRMNAHDPCHGLLGAIFSHPRGSVFLLAMSE